MSDKVADVVFRAIITPEETGRGRTNTALQLLETWRELDE